jgi:hypothetical protein
MLRQVQNEMFIFEIDSENALVNCTLERLRSTLFSIPTSEDLNSIKILVAAFFFFCNWSILKNSPNPIAKSSRGYRTPRGSPPT